MGGITTEANLESLSQCSATLTLMFKPGFAEVLNEETTLWSLLPKRRSLAEAVRVKFKVGKDGRETYASAYTDYASYVEVLDITDYAEVAAMAKGRGNYEVWADEVARAATDMRRDLESDLWGRQLGVSSLGILDALDDAGDPPAYLGLARACCPFLYCTLVNAGGEGLSFSTLRRLFRHIHHGAGRDMPGDLMTFRAEDQGGGRADVVLTTREIETAYEALVTSNSRYPIPPAANSRVDPGLTDLLYKRAPVLGSRFCPDGNLFALDLSTWSVEILPQTLIDSNGVRQSDFALVVEGRAGGKVTVFWRVYFQLVCSKPWRNGRIVNIAHGKRTNSPKQEG